MKRLAKIISLWFECFFNVDYLYIWFIFSLLKSTQHFVTSLVLYRSSMCSLQSFRRHRHVHTKTSNSTTDDHREMERYSRECARYFISAVPQRWTPLWELHVLNCRFRRISQWGINEVIKKKKNWWVQIFVMFVLGWTALVVSTLMHQNTQCLHSSLNSLSFWVIQGIRVVCFTMNASMLMHAL